MSERRRSAALAWLSSLAVAAWCVGFLEPGQPASWLVVPLAAIGIGIGWYWPLAGTLLVLAASVVATLTGMRYGTVELLLPTMLTLFRLGRTSRMRVAGIICTFGFVVATAMRAPDGIATATATSLLVYGSALLFGAIVERRAADANAAAAEAERLASLDIERIRRDTASASRRSVTAAALHTMQACVERVEQHATAAADSLADAPIGAIQRECRRALRTLHETLGLLEARAQAGSRTESAATDDADGGSPTEPLARGDERRDGGAHPVAVSVTGMWRAVPARIRRTVLTALASAGMYLASVALGAQWLQIAPIVLALALPVAVAVAITRPVVGAIIAACGFAIAAFAQPHPPEILLPSTIPLLVLSWRSAQLEPRWRGLLALGATTAGALSLAAAHGPSGIGYVLVIVVVVAGGSHAWSERDRVAQREELRAARITARLASARLGADIEARRRLAGELHDLVSHAVASMSLQSEAARSHLARGDDAAARMTLATIAETATRIRDELDRMLGTVADRATAPALSAGQFDVAELVDEAHALGLRITADLDIDGEDPLAYRLVLEGLTNAARYAPGSQVDVSVSSSGGTRVVRVRNGPADSSATRLPGRGAGTGLQRLGENVRARRGTFSAMRTGEGFELRASWPISERDRTPAARDATAAKEQS